MRVNLTGKALERSLLWRLDWVNFLYVPRDPAPCPQIEKRQMGEEEEEEEEEANDE